MKPLLYFIASFIISYTLIWLVMGYMQWNLHDYLYMFNRLPKGLDERITLIVFIMLNVCLTLFPSAFKKKEDNEVAGILVGFLMMGTVVCSLSLTLLLY